MSTIGLHCKSLLWLHSFLSNRTQCVRVRDAISIPLAVSSGVIQGSILGPVLFTIYINPLLMELEDSVAFADDVKFVAKADKKQSVVTQSSINKLARWSDSYFMPLSLEKCFVLHCGKSNPRLVYTCRGCQLSVVDEINDLGVRRTNISTASYQSSAIVTKANRVAGLILRTFHTRDSAVLWKAFSVYVTPILMYASQCWNPSLQRDVIACENVQRRFSKRLFGLHELSYEERLRHLQAMTLENSRAVSDITLAYRVLHGLYDVSAGDIGISVQRGTTRGSNLRLVVPLSRNAAVKSFYRFRLPVLWNKLPLCTLSASNFFAFKRAVCEHYISHFKN